MESNATNRVEYYIQALAHTPHDYATIREFLKFLRQTKLRCSQLVAKYGSQLLKNYSFHIEAIELWDIYEQVFIAALDAHDTSLANDLINKIIKQFGQKSIRIRRLVGMQLEAQGKWKKAEDLYNSILEEDPANVMAMKRQICIRKAMGDTVTTIKILNEYLKIFMADTDAWHELAELYVSQQMYSNAAFCYEELILAFPQNYHFFSKYAEILYTTGGYENYKLSRKNFAYSFELNPTPCNLRALFGICMAAIAVASTKQGKQDKENNEIFEWAHNKLTASYKNENMVEKLELLKSFAIANDKSSEGK